MEQYRFKAINLIAKTLQEKELKFDVVESESNERIRVGFPINGGPNVLMAFIATDDDNDVAARLFGLVTNVPASKRSRVLEACNLLNNKARFLKFDIDVENDINVEYDFPVESSDDTIGEMAYEIFIRTVRILDTYYPLLMKAIYSNDVLDIDALEHSDAEEEEADDDMDLEALAAETAAIFPFNGSTPS